MSKINYISQERAFDDTMARFRFEYLSILADLAGSFGLMPIQQPELNPEQRARVQNFAVTNLKYALKALSRHKGYIKRLHIKKSDVRHYMMNAGKLTDEEFARIQEILWNIRDIRHEIREKLLPEDEVIIESERKRSRNLRFNTKDHWLPLH
ncbi:MAG: hypothetical protein KDK48_06305 [Chlamydiia bacterium]|nr:hypothetical protein [Chlamydiia bacterium]